MNAILVPLDGSALAEQVLPSVRQLAPLLGAEVHLLHVIGASELDPAARFTRGMLVDVESGASRPLVLTATIAERYREVLALHLDALAAVAERCRCRYARYVAGTDLAQFVSGTLAEIGLVRRR